MFRTPPPSQIIIMINLRACVAAHVFPGHVINHATKLTSKKEGPHTMKLFCQLQFSVRSYLDFAPLGIINSFKLVVVQEFVSLSFFLWSWQNFFDIGEICKYSFVGYYGIILELCQYRNLFSVEFLYTFIFEYVFFFRRKLHEVLESFFRSDCITILMS